MHGQNHIKVVELFVVVRVVVVVVVVVVKQNLLFDKSLSSKETGSDPKKTVFWKKKVAKATDKNTEWQGTNVYTLWKNKYCHTDPAE